MMKNNHGPYLMYGWQTLFFTITTFFFCTQSTSKHPKALLLAVLSFDVAEVWNRLIWEKSFFLKICWQTLLPFPRATPYFLRMSSFIPWAPGGVKDFSQKLSNGICWHSIVKFTNNNCEIHYIQFWNSQAYFSLVVKMCFALHLPAFNCEKILFNWISGLWWAEQPDAGSPQIFFYFLDLLFVSDWRKLTRSERR